MNSHSFLTGWNVFTSSCHAKTISGGEIFDWDIKKEDNLKEEAISGDL